jgi:hypothetical protein
LSWPCAICGCENSIVRYFHKVVKSKIKRSPIIAAENWVYQRASVGGSASATPLPVPPTEANASAFYIIRPRRARVMPQRNARWSRRLRTCCNKTSQFFLQEIICLVSNLLSEIHVCFSDKIKSKNGVVTVIPQLNLWLANG